MDRAVPTVASEEIELYRRTYYSLLRSSGEVQIRALIESHLRMDSSLHVNARSEYPDINAYVYSALRLPPMIDRVRLVLLGQSEEVFAKGGYPDVEAWEKVAAPGRRRKMFFDGQETLAALIGSASDIDDMVPILTAFQIEWDKFHYLLNASRGMEILERALQEERTLSDLERDTLCEILHLTPNDWRVLSDIWTDQLLNRLHAMGAHRKKLSLRLLSGSLVDYRKATQRWWEHIARAAGELLADDRPVYFVSSNTHSLTNLVSGYAQAHEQELIEYLREPRHASLLREYQAIVKEEIPSSKENFLYYVLKKYQGDPDRGPAAQEDRQRAEAEVGILTIPSERYFDVDAQIIEMCRLDPDRMDPRIPREGLARACRSRAVIFNIDYPLGLAAYQILAQFTQSVGPVRGIYVMGKSASLNARIGDILIPNVVYDEHSKNSFLFNNCFSARDVEPYSVYGAALDNQKAVSVRGTFLENEKFMDVFYREGYTDIEMEAGPYLSAVYEMLYPVRFPDDQIVRLYHANFDVGILHYTTDTPYSKGKNLGSIHLSYYGMDPTYATALAILRRIFAREMG